MTTTQRSIEMGEIDQYTLANPVDRYPKITPPETNVAEPGLEADLTPAADHGETTYRGTGRLKGRKALITGADSGIGAAVTIAFAREGADVVLSYRPRRRRTLPGSPHWSSRRGARPSEYREI